jgi:hypothetical protein
VVRKSNTAYPRDDLIGRFRKTLDSLEEENIDRALIELLDTAFVHFLKSDSETQLKNDYSNRIIDELNDWVVDNDRHTGIDKVLIHLNFNSRRYFLFYIHKISEVLANEDSITGKLEVLATKYKEVNQILVDTQIGYTSKYPPLNEIISRWIDEETNFLNKRRQLALALPKSESATGTAFRLPMDMSVAQIACLTRAFIERKVLLSNNLSELAGFLASVIVTKRSEGVSEGSFRRKYYNIEDGTKKSVIEILNKTIDWLMKN